MRRARTVFGPVVAKPNHLRVNVSIVQNRTAFMSACGHKVNWASLKNVLTFGAALPYLGVR